MEEICYNNKYFKKFVMQTKKRIIAHAFMATVILGALIVLIEIVFQSFGKTICPTEGCEIVSQNTRFGDIPILFIGFTTFSALSILSYLTLYKNKRHFDKYINIILIASLAAEGYLIGYQTFSISMACVFCLIIFAFFTVSGILRLLYGEKEVIAGFLSFSAVFALFYLIVPGNSMPPFPKGELILFYSKDCKYCAEIMNEIEANKIKVLYHNAREYAGYLKSIGIEHVPTLFVNKNYRKFFLTGKEEIKNYLFAEPINDKGDEKKYRPRPQIKKMTGNGSDKNANRQSLLLERLFTPGDITGDLFTPQVDEGMCKGIEETEECK